MAPLKAAYSTNLSVTLCNRTRDSKSCALYTHQRSNHPKSCMWYISVVLMVVSDHYPGSNYIYHQP